SALAMETSGHGAMKENYFLDDGAYTIVKILIKMARMKINHDGDITELIKDLEEPVESKEFRISLLEEDFKKQGEHIIDELERYTTEHHGWNPAAMNHEGMRIETEQGWFLLRLSLHDPVLPLNVESNIAGGARHILGDVSRFLQRFENIEHRELNDFLNNRER
ncbi:phosphomannomutase/phosphoglucomutase, partial [candidate division KSB3 bacterium]